MAEWLAMIMPSAASSSSTESTSTPDSGAAGSATWALVDQQKSFLDAIELLRLPAERHDGWDHVNLGEFLRDVRGLNYTEFYRLIHAYIVPLSPKRQHAKELIDAARARGDPDAIMLAELFAANTDESEHSVVAWRRLNAVMGLSDDLYGDSDGEN